MAPLECCGYSGWVVFCALRYGLAPWAALSALALAGCDPKKAHARPIPAVSAAPRPEPAPGKSSAPPTARSMRVDPAPHDGCPPEMTRVGKVCVDRWEDSLADPYDRIHDPSLRPIHGIEYSARSLQGVRPQAYISRLEARAACENAGKRLCTLGEWYAACRGPAHTDYPYGQKFDRTRCNVEKPHLLSRLFGNNPLSWKYAANFNSPALDREPGFLAKTGAYPACTNGYGTFDMVGNLHEWVSDTVDSSLPAKIPLRDGIRVRVAADTGHGIFMGGFFSTASQHGQGCGFITIGHGPTYHDYSTGFRCCRSAAAVGPATP